MHTEGAKIQFLYNTSVVYTSFIGESQKNLWRKKAAKKSRGGIWEKKTLWYSHQTSLSTHDEGIRDTLQTSENTSVNKLWSHDT